jgi:multidrug efflux pump
MEEKQQQLASIVLQDPAVESLSSFIGADGTNTTLNSGRMSINLKPIGDRDLSAADVIRRLQTKLKDVQGIQLYMSPVQNITVDDRVSRTQYQYTLEDPDVNELNLWTGKLVDKMKQLPQLADVATDQQTGGLAVSLVIDRVTASRLGIAPNTIDNTLYDAFGQRQISTMYTQLNQYHVILEADPAIQTSPAKLQDLYIQTNASSGTRAQAHPRPCGFRGLRPPVRMRPPPRRLHAIFGSAHRSPRMPDFRRGHTSSSSSSSSNTATSSTPSGFRSPERIHSSAENHRGALHQSPGQFPAVTVSFNLAPDAALGGAITAINKAQKDLEHAGQRAVWIPGHRGRIRGLALQ